MRGHNVPEAFSGPGAASDGFRPPAGAAPEIFGRSFAATTTVVFIALITIAVFLLTAQPALAVAALLACVGGYGVWKAPLRRVLYLLLFVACAVFAPPAVDGLLWRVVRPVQDFMFVYLNRLTGFEPLALLGLEAVYLLLLALAIIRVWRGNAVDATNRSPSANALLGLLACSFCAVVWLELWGLARGGDFRGSLFQFRQLLWLPLLTWLATYALRTPRDWYGVAIAVTAGTSVKAALGAYYLMHDMWPTGIYPVVMTSHHDSVLFVAVFFLWCAAWLHRPRARTILPTLLVCGWMLLALVLNGRRVAYVSLLASLFVLYVLLRGPVKRWTTRNALRALPLALLYLFVARSHPSGVFKPGNAIVSVLQQNDASSTWRDAEDFNLRVTLEPNKLLGSGWGHEYNEVLKLDDISRYMPQYRLVAHNSILWLLGIGGIIGFVFLWLPIAAGVYFGARSYHFARDPFERTAAASALAVLVAFVNQSWGDMGTQGSVTILLVAFALALAGKLARANGAWPNGVRIFGRRERD